MSVQVMITTLELSKANWRLQAYRKSTVSQSHLSLDQGDLWLPWVGEDFAMGRSLIQGVLPWAYNL